MSAVTTDRLIARADRISDKSRLRKILEEQDRATGFVMDLSTTLAEVRALMIEQGVKPGENSFSCEIRRGRESKA